MLKYKLAIFDMDGTILNTLDDLTDSTNYCLKKFGMPEKTRDQVRVNLGNGTRHLFEMVVPEGTDDKTLEDIIAVYNDYYKNHCMIKTGPYDGILELLRRLREAGVLTAVVSNKPEYAVKSLCHDLFNGLFDMSVGDKEGQRIKPYPDSVNSIVETFNIDKTEAVYIGDSEVDFKTAENAGLDVIMVSWGFRQIEQIRALGAKCIVDTPEEVGNVILNT